MRVLIVEDEIMARQSLARALTQHFPDLHIVGTTGSVRETVGWLRTPGNVADVIFMDVETVCTKFNVQPMRINRLLRDCVHTVVQEICLTGIIISSQTVLLPIICRITWPWKI